MQINQCFGGENLNYLKKMVAKHKPLSINIIWNTGKPTQCFFNMLLGDLRSPFSITTDNQNLFVYSKADTIFFNDLEDCKNFLHNAGYLVFKMPNDNKYKAINSDLFSDELPEHISRECLILSGNPAEIDISFHYDTTLLFDIGFYPLDGDVDEVPVEFLKEYFEYYKQREQIVQKELKEIESFKSRLTTDLKLLYELEDYQ